MKRFIKQSLCSLLFYSGLFHFTKFLSSRIKKQAVVLCYHRVVTGKPDTYSIQGTQVDLQNFRSQVELLLRHFTVIRLSDLIERMKEGEKAFDRNYAVLTFDDGFRDSYTNVFTILKDYGLPAVFFVSPGMLESSGLFWQNESWYLLNKPHHKRIFQWGGREWDLTSQTEKAKLNNIIRKNLFESCSKGRDDILKKIRSDLGSGHPTSTGNRLMLSAYELSEMKRSGLVELGAHSMTHTLLSKCSEEDLNYEIRQSKSGLEAVWEQEIVFFAYPFGDYTTSAMDSLKKNGYIAAVTLDDGLVKGSDNLLALKRISVVRDDTLPIILVIKILPFYLKCILKSIKGIFYGYRKG